MASLPLSSKKQTNIKRKTRERKKIKEEKTGKKGVTENERGRNSKYVRG